MPKKSLAKLFPPPPETCCFRLEQSEELDQFRQTAPGPIRKRIQAVILNSRKFSSNQIVRIYEVDLDTVRLWLDYRDQGGASGFSDEGGRGCKPILNDTLYLSKS
jgi:hypothetical protein